MKLSEEMDITSELTPENEAQYAQNFILDKWIRVFGDQFVRSAGEITTESVIHSCRSVSRNAYRTELDGLPC